MAHHKPIANLLSIFDLLADPYEDDKIDCQEVIDYSESRFRVILQTMFSSTAQDQE